MNDRVSSDGEAIGQSGPFTAASDPLASPPGVGPIMTTLADDQVVITAICRAQAAKGGRSKDLDDVVQETCVRLIAYDRRHNGRCANVEALTTTIARNVVADLWRTRIGRTSAPFAHSASRERDDDRDEVTRTETAERDGAKHAIDFFQPGYLSCLKWMRTYRPSEMAAWRTFIRTCTTPNAGNEGGAAVRRAHSYLTWVMCCYVHVAMIELFGRAFCESDDEIAQVAELVGLTRSDQDLAVVALAERIVFCAVDQYRAGTNLTAIAAALPRRFRAQFPRGSLSATMVYMLVVGLEPGDPDQRPPHRHARGLASSEAWRLKAARAARRRADGGRPAAVGPAAFWIRSLLRALPTVTTPTGTSVMPPPFGNVPHTRINRMPTIMDPAAQPEVPVSPQHSGAELGSIALRRMSEQRIAWSQDASAHPGAVLARRLCALPHRARDRIIDHLDLVLDRWDSTIR